MEGKLTMAILVGAALLFFAVTALVLVTLFHLIFGLPLWLLVGGVALFIWMRRDSRRHRYLGRGRSGSGYLDSHSRW
jgi:hypothetical protein